MYSSVPTIGTSPTPQHAHTHKRVGAPPTHHRNSSFAVCGFTHSRTFGDRLLHHYTRLTRRTQTHHHASTHLSGGKPYVGMCPVWVGEVPRTGVLSGVVGSGMWSWLWVVWIGKRCMAGYRLDGIQDDLYGSVGKRDAVGRVQVITGPLWY